MGQKRWLFLLKLFLLILLGGALGLAAFWSAFWGDSIYWTVALCLPAALVVFWPIANHLATRPYRRTLARHESVLEVGLRFLGTVLAAISGAGAAIAGGTALVWAAMGQSDRAIWAALLGLKALGICAGLVAFVLALVFGGDWLSRKVKAVEIDILYLCGAGTAMLVFGSLVLGETWIGYLDPQQIADRNALATWIGVLGVVYAIVQIIAATEKEKRAVTSDSTTTAVVVIIMAALFWALGEAFVPVVIGVLAWLGALVLDKECNRSKW